MVRERDEDGFINEHNKGSPETLRVAETITEIFINRYLPVLSLTYIASLLGMALKRGGVTHFAAEILADKAIYWLAFGVGVWVSIPAMIWICIRSVGTLVSYANNWYKSTTLLMVIVLLGSFLLFPPNGQGSQWWYTARLFVAAAIPIHVIQYWFFTREGLPTNISATLGAIALALFLYGMIVI
ncbi:MAG: hypothetical protein AB7E85_03335 [Pseudobdellovibrionaceae bacterium]